jgi:long-chain acyl-CoA synthetase
LARALQARGIGAGSVMAIVAPNGAEFVAIFLAATQIGMYVVPINWKLTAPEIRYILQDCGATVLFANSRFRKVIDDAVSHRDSNLRIRISLGGVIPGFEGIEQYVHGCIADPIFAPVQGRVLSYTSATTGKPKGVRLPLHESERALDLSIALRIGAGTLPEVHVHLCASMLYHGAPLEGVIIALHMGHVVVLMDHIEPEEVLRAIDKYKVTIAYLVPSMFSKLLMLDVEVTGRYSVASLQKVLHVGAPCPVNIKRRMIEWWGPIFWEAYGATEGAGTVASSQDWLKYPGTVGKPMPGSHVRIVGENGLDVPSGVTGLVYFTRYSGDRFEYLNDRKKTEAAYLGDFLTVGDLGYLNSDGFLFLCDRAVDVINRSGAKIYPAELEGLIAGQPGVADCAVIGIPDVQFGEAILAVIQPALPSADRESLRRQIVRHLAKSVSIFKVPTHFALIERIPRDASGKVQKRLLRSHFSNDSTPLRLNGHDSTRSCEF